MADFEPSRHLRFMIKKAYRIGTKRRFPTYV